MDGSNGAGFQGKQVDLEFILKTNQQLNFVSIFSFILKEIGELEVTLQENKCFFLLKENLFCF